MSSLAVEAVWIPLPGEGEGELGPSLVRGEVGVLVPVLEEGVAWGHAPVEEEEGGSDPSPLQGVQF